MASWKPKNLKIVSHISSQKSLTIKIYSPQKKFHVSGDYFTSCPIPARHLPSICSRFKILKIFHTHENAHQMKNAKKNLSRIRNKLVHLNETIQNDYLTEPFLAKL